MCVSCFCVSVNISASSSCNRRHFIKSVYFKRLDASIQSLTNWVIISHVGGASVQYQMANEISRKYFNRGFAQSTSGFSAWALRRANHIPEIQNCTQIYEMNELIGYLKTANSSAFEKCYPWQLLGPLDPTWVPTIECPTAKKAFMTKPLEDIYRSNNLAMDAMFSFTPEEMITFLPELLNSTEPLIKPNWKETNFTLPFEGFTKDDYPKVSV